MLKGTRTVQVTKIQPVSIHGQISLDVYLHRSRRSPESGQPRARRRRIRSQEHRSRRHRRSPLHGGGCDEHYEEVELIAFCLFPFAFSLC